MRSKKLPNTKALNSKTTRALNTTHLTKLMKRPACRSDHYAQHAAAYDASAQRTMALRRRTIDKLALCAGQVVLDVGCGTGLSFGLLQNAIGPDGVLIGLEQSTSMLELARQRVDNTTGHKGITLLNASAEDVELPQHVDALLFNYTHDVIRSPSALHNLFVQTKPGARVAVAGIKHPPRWADPFRLYRRFKSRGCFNTLEGLDAPWSLLQAYVPNLQVQSTLWGTGFMAWGRVQHTS